MKEVVGNLFCILNFVLFFVLPFLPFPALHHVLNVSERNYHVDDSHSNKKYGRCLLVLREYFCLNTLSTPLTEKKYINMYL